MTLPPSEVLAECADIATTGDAARYLAVNVEAIFAKERVLDQFRGLVQKFHEHADAVEAGEWLQENIWGGDTPVTEYAADAERRVETEERRVTPVPEEADKVVMDVAFDEEGLIDRGYLVNNESPDEDMVKRLDSLLHGWFAKENLLCRSQRIYEATDAGDVKLDTDNQPVQVDSLELKDGLLDERSGLKQYVKSHAKQVEIEALQVKVAGEPGIAPEQDTAIGPE
ncbi:MAG: hypothetical protein P1U32_04415 [Legionellaceae bacterium]|nr:hypothetical protein [Legionellaceae bacterium]